MPRRSTSQIACSRWATSLG
jgi:hypothetical protein